MVAPLLHVVHTLPSRPSTSPSPFQQLTSFGFCPFSERDSKHVPHQPSPVQSCASYKSFSVMSWCHSDSLSPTHRTQQALKAANIVQSMCALLHGRTVGPQHWRYIFFPVPLVFGHQDANCVASVCLKCFTSLLLCGCSGVVYLLCISK